MCRHETRPNAKHRAVEPADRSHCARASRSLPQRGRGCVEARVRYASTCQASGRPTGFDESRQSKPVRARGAARAPTQGCRGQAGRDDEHLGRRGRFVSARAPISDETAEESQAGTQRRPARLHPVLPSGGAEVGLSQAAAKSDGGGVPVRVARQQAARNSSTFLFCLRAV